jgi:hypothetical protein
MAARDIQPPLVFTGAAEVGKINQPFDLTPINFIQAVQARQLKQGWNNQTTMNNVIAALQHEAANWFVQMLPQMTSKEEYQLIKTDFTAFSKVFCAFYKITSTVTALNINSMGAQKPGEKIMSYMGRIITAIRSSIMPDPLVEVQHQQEPVPAALQDLTVPQADALTTLLLRQEERCLDRDRRRAIDSMVMRLACSDQGLRHPQLRTHAHLLLQDDCSLATFLEKISNYPISEPLPSKSKPWQGKSKQVSEITGEQEVEQVEEEGDAAAIKSKSSKKDFKKKKTWPPGKNPGLKPDGSKKFCNYCRRFYHEESECRTKKAVAQQGGAAAVHVAVAQDQGQYQHLNFLGGF